MVGTPEQLRSRLRFATCPACGKPNPTTRSDPWTSRTTALSVGLALFLSAGSFKFPIAGAAFTAGALVVPHVVGMILRKQAGEPLAPRGLFQALHFGVALVFAAHFWPRIVFLGPLAVFLIPLVLRRVSEQADWTRASRELRWMAKEAPEAPP